MFKAPRIFNLYKEVGPTSFDIVRSFKRSLPRGVKKIGHFGTLDPFADGILLTGFSGAMKMNDLLHEFLPKTYKAKGVFGAMTSTGDREGSIEKRKELGFNKKYDRSLAESFLREHFLGDYQQRPPCFSACKHEGRPLYEWAREGIMIEKPPVKRFIHSLSILEFSEESCLFEVRVSTGTYIRVLFQEMAKALGQLGFLETLTRTQIGPLKIEDALPSTELSREKLSEQGFAPWDVFVRPRAQCTERSQYAFLNGHKVTAFTMLEPPTDKYVWVTSLDSQVMGLGTLEKGVITCLINWAPGLNFLY